MTRLKRASALAPPRSGSLPEDAARSLDRVWLAALAVAGVDLLAVASLSVFFATGGPFGAINDAANGAVGVLSVLLAREVSRASRTGPTDVLLVGLAGAGGAISVTGTYLVVSGSAGWYLAGLVSGVGNALIGAWLLGSSLRQARAVRGAEAAEAQHSRRLRRLGVAAGGVMLLGLVGLPGVVGRGDDWESASWLVSAGLVGWLGTYALYPAWCLRLARGMRQD